MKHSAALFLCVCLILSFTACSAMEPMPTASQAQTILETTAGTTLATAEPATAEYYAHLAAVSMPLITETIQDDNGTIISKYNYQNISVNLQDGDVAEAITLDMLNRIDSTISAAERVHVAAQNAYNDQVDWYPYFYIILYRGTRLDQNILSFFGHEAAYDGSSRATPAPTSINYDLATGNTLSIRTIFYEEYSNDFLCDLIIEGLSSYTSGELFSDYQDIIRQKFFTNTPVETWYFSDEGLCFYFSPYEIGAYSAGTIISVIPYHKLSGILRDAYFPNEALTYSGTVEIKPITRENATILDQFTQFGEVIIAENSDKLLLCADGSVTDLCIVLTTDDPYTTGTMIYATAGLGSQHATIIEAPTDTLKDMVISYNSNGTTVTVCP